MPLNKDELEKALKDEEDRYETKLHELENTSATEGARRLLEHAKELTEVQSKLEKDAQQRTDDAEVRHKTDLEQA